MYIEYIYLPTLHIYLLHSTLHNLTYLTTLLVWLHYNVYIPLAGSTSSAARHMLLYRVGGWPNLTARRWFLVYVVRVRAGLARWWLTVICR